MPLGLHVLPNIGRLTTEWALSGFSKPMDKFVDLLSVMVEAFNPMGASGFSLQTITPTPLDPLVALAENKDWTGKQIYRENFSSLAPTPGFTRTKDTATFFSKGLSWALNRMSGGTEYKPGLFSPTPDQIDYLGGQITGGIGREIGKTAQVIETTAKGEEIPSYKIPLAGRFYGSTEGQAQTASRFYNNLKTMNQHEAEIKGRRSKRESVSGYLKDNPEAKLWPLANNAESSVAKLTKRKRMLTDRKASKEAIQRINDLIYQAMGRFNERIEAAKR